MRVRIYRTLKSFLEYWEEICTMASRDVDYREIVPECWRVKVSDKKDFVGLGSGNLVELKGHWLQKKKDLAGYIEWHLSQVAKLEDEVEEIEEYFKVIRKALGKSEPKPLFSRLRQTGYFSLEDRVVCYVLKDTAKIGDEIWHLHGTIKSGVFVTGRVVQKPFHGESVVVETDEQVFDYQYGNNHRLEYNHNRPEIMHQWEYDYFRAHPDYYRIWAMASSGMAEFDPNMIDALG